MLCKFRAIRCQRWFGCLGCVDTKGLSDPADMTWIAGLQIERVITLSLAHSLLLAVFNFTHSAVFNFKFGKRESERTDGRTDGRTAIHS
jgi:hypothetical protein